MEPSLVLDAYVLYVVQTGSGSDYNPAARWRFGNKMQLFNVKNKVGYKKPGSKFRFMRVGTVWSSTQRLVDACCGGWWKVQGLLDTESIYRRY